MWSSLHPPPYVPPGRIMGLIFLARVMSPPEGVTQVSSSSSSGFQGYKLNPYRVTRIGVARVMQTSLWIYSQE